MLSIMDPYESDSEGSGSWITADSEDAGDENNAASTSAQTPDQAQKTKGLGQHGCQHYRRRCMLVAPCCKEAFWCRHCHNAVKHDNQQDPQLRHMLDRRAVQQVVCALCNLKQPSGLECLSCGVEFGQYSCLICNFFDDDLTKKQYHCTDCGICRVGGRDAFFHCTTCNCCYALALRDSHVCVENSMHQCVVQHLDVSRHAIEQNCPVCFEFLFDSVKPINVLPCGHTIHQTCLRQLTDHHAFVCPICTKTFVNEGNAARLWEQMDIAVSQTPMPEEYRDKKINVLCNDCSSRSEVAFHVIGHKCRSCGGYNTRRV